MSETFTASNGVTVESFGSFGESYIRVSGVTLDDAYEGVALREFFQHERDKELGRWRWAEYSEWVAYPGDDDTVWVFDEEAHYLTRVGRNEVSGVQFSNNSALAAARAYFAAHPESKPWHDAKPGEVWELRVLCGPPNPYGVSGSGEFRHAQDGDIVRAEITDGRRIWPEGD